MTVNNGDIIRVVVNGTVDGKNIQNTYHVQLEGPGSLADSAVKAAIQTKISDMYADVAADTSADLVYGLIELYNLTQDIPMASGVMETRGQPTNIDGRLPPATSGLVVFDTLAPRSQGRKYLAGFVENASAADGSPDNDVLTAMAAYAAEAIASWIVGSFTLQFGNWNPTLLRFAEWVGAAVVGEWRTQRRRYVSRGT